MRGNFKLARQLVTTFLVWCLAAAALGDATVPVAYRVPGVYRDRTLLAMSPDGRFLVVQSRAPNLVPNDRNTQDDIFLYDRTSSVIQRISVSSSGTQSPDVSGIIQYDGADVSADGWFVAFASRGTGLVPNDLDGRTDVFLRDTLVGTTIRLSVSASGVEPNQSCGGPSISDDGRFVAFSSIANNLVPGDTNGQEDIFLRDAVAGTIQRINVTLGGVQGNARSSLPVISPDGRYVLFQTWATNLSQDGSFQVVMYDRLFGTLTTVSLGTGGLVPDGASYVRNITPDNRFLLFDSEAPNLTGSTLTTLRQVYLRDIASNVTTLVSVDNQGAMASSGYNFAGSVSPDGSKVLFCSTSPLLSGSIGMQQIVLRNLSTGASTVLTNGDGVSYGYLSSDGSTAIYQSTSSNLTLDENGTVQDVFEQSIATGTIQKTPVGTPGLCEIADTHVTWISPDEDFIAFTCDNALVPSDTNGATDVYLEELSSGTVSLLTLGNAGVQANNGCGEGACDASREHVAFTSRATNLVVGESPSFTQVYVRDTSTGAITRVSRSTVGGFADKDCSKPKLSSDGRYVLFESTATNLVPGDTNNKADIFMVDLPLGTTACVSHGTAGAPGNNTAYSADMSPSGRHVAFGSVSTNMDGTGRTGIWLRDMATDALTFISQSSGGVTASGSSDFPAVSDDGRYVAFQSYATNITPESVNGAFVRDVLAGTTTYVSKGYTGLNTYGDAPIDMSGDGSTILYKSSAPTTVPGNFSSYNMLYASVIGAQAPERISITSDGMWPATTALLECKVGASARIATFYDDLQVACAYAKTSYIRKRNGLCRFLPATNYQIVRGRYFQGDLNSLLFVDLNRLGIRPGPVFTTLQSPISVEFETTSPYQSLSHLAIERSYVTSTSGVEEKVEVYNFATGQYDMLSNEIAADTNGPWWPLASPQSYVGPGGLLRMRLSFRLTQATFSWPWDVSFDAIAWFVDP